MEYEFWVSRNSVWLGIANGEHECYFRVLRSSRFGSSLRRWAAKRPVRTDRPVVLLQPDCFTLNHELFAGHIEKGVIRRGRARGVFLAGASDVDAAQRCFRELVSSAPPLTV